MVLITLRPHLGMKTVSARWILRLLTPEQKLQYLYWSELFFIGLFWTELFRKSRVTVLTIHYSCKNNLLLKQLIKNNHFLLWKCLNLIRYNPTMGVLDNYLIILINTSVAQWGRMLHSRIVSICIMGLKCVRTNISNIGHEWQIKYGPWKMVWNNFIHQLL